MSAQEIRRKAQKLDAENRRDITMGFVLTLGLTVFGLAGLLTLQRLELAARVIIAIALLLVWLETAIHRGFINYSFLSQHDKALMKLHGDPRFEALMQKAQCECEHFDV
jgi:hypothetical protein